MAEIPAAADWLSYRIPAVSAGDIPILLHEVVRPTVEELGLEISEFRWFFLRYFDPAGLHSRLRLRVPVDLLTDVDAVIEGTLNNSPAARLGWVRRLYAPETDKFGVGPAMDRAERLFQLSSEVALVCASPERRGDRIPQAAAVTNLLTADLPAPARRTFLRLSAGPPNNGPSTYIEPDIQRRAMRLDGRRRMVLADPAVHRKLDAFALAFRRFAGSSAATDNSDLRFQHIHLTNNRLGVFPAEEAAIARLLLALDS